MSRGIGRVGINPAHRPKKGMCERVKVKLRNSRKAVKNNFLLSDCKIFM